MLRQKKKKEKQIKKRNKVCSLRKQVKAKFSAENTDI